MGNSTTNGTNGHATTVVTYARGASSFADSYSEQALLGAMLMSTDAIEHAAQRVPREAFQFAPNLAVYDAILMAHASGRGVDVATVSARLINNPALADVDGHRYLIALWEACSTALHATAYASQVLEAWNRKRAWEAGNNLLAAIHGEDRSEYERALQSLQATNQWGPPQPKRFQMFSSEEMESMEPPHQLIDGVLPTDSLVCLFGPSGSYKSFLVLDMAASIANGLKWAGLDTLAGKVVYVVGEGKSGMGKRHRAWRTHRGVERIQNLHTITEAPNMTRREDADALIQSIADLPEKPLLVVLDTMHVCMEGADENSSRDVGLFIANAKRIRDATGATVLFVHHTGNNERVRGSSSIKGDVDNMLEVRSQDDRATLFPFKVKDGPNFEPMTFQRVKVGEYPAGSLVFDLTISEPVGAKEDNSDEKVLTVLRDTFPDGCKLTAWKEACIKAKISESTFWRSKGRLVEANEATSLGGRWVARTDDSTVTVTVKES